MVITMTFITINTHNASAEAVPYMLRCLVRLSAGKPATQPEIFLILSRKLPRNCRWSQSSL